MAPVGLMEPLDGRPPLVSSGLFLIERLMLPAEAPRAYRFAVPSRIVLWQHVDDLLATAVLPKKSGQRVLGLKLGTLSWYDRPLATRSPPPHMEDELS